VYLHCFTHGEDELIRFGVGFRRSYVICPGCYHSYETAADLENADYDVRSNAAGHAVDKREPEDIDRCPLCTTKFLITQGM
jgi:hypothetical protein